jgi:ribonuclease HI
MHVTTCSDCRRALDRIAKLEDGSSLVPEEPNLQILADILDKARLLNQMEVYVDLVWVPGHYGDRGNEYADKFANQAAKRALQIPPPQSEFVFV